MALLSRLFSSRKNDKSQFNLNSDKRDRSGCKPFTFGKDQVRVLLFRECDWRGRKLLFDSNAVQKVSLDNSSCKLRFTSRPKVDKCKKEAYVEVTNGFGYQYTKPSSDATLLGEMMFGAVAMTFRGTALKVHAMSTPNRVMCTKVFSSPVVMHSSRRTSDRSLEDSYGSSVNSMSESCQNSGSESLIESGPLDVPSGEITGLKPSRYNSLEGDSGFCGDFSLQSISSIGSPSYWTPIASPETRTSFGSLCGNKQSGGSLSSLQRRWIRNMSTSLELGLAQADEGPSCSGQHRRTRLGLSVVISLTPEHHRQMEMYLFEHMSVIESMIERLRFSVERAYLRKDTFVHVMHDGWTDLQQSLYDMVCAPRLSCPIWLSLTSTENKSHSSLAAMFLQDLCVLISTLDTKATNFFVSTLVTGVLTHHLGWVNTVWPASAHTSNYVQSSTNESLNDLLRSHPYNPLWAQLGDLYGALGSPAKVAKTIITSNGRKNDCVNKLLSCMTYFIRCGEVKEKQDLRQDENEFIVEGTNVNCTSQKPDGVGFFSKFLRKSTKGCEDKEGDKLDSLSLDLQVKNCAFLKSEGSSVSMDSLKLNSDLSYVRSDSCVSPLSDHRTISSSTLSLSPPKIEGSFLSVCNSDARGKGNAPSNPICTNCKPPESSRLLTYSRANHEPASHGAEKKCSHLSRRGSKSPSGTNAEDKNRSPPEIPTSSCPVSELPQCSVGGDAGVSSFLPKNPDPSLKPDLERKVELNEFSSRALRGGNFASPAGAEWENDSVERKVPSELSDRFFPTGDDSTSQNRPGPNPSPPRENQTHYEKCDGFSHNLRLPTGLSDTIDTKTVLSANQKSIFLLQPGEHLGESTLKSASGGSDEGSGVSCMKRTSSCISKLGDLKNISMQAGSGSRTSLYPNIEELAKMENVQLDSEQEYVGYLSNETYHDESESIESTFKTGVRVPEPKVKVIVENISEAINEKVTKLCRVPTSAVLFHVEGEENEFKFKALELERFEGKRLHSERQLAAVEDSHVQRLKTVSMPSFQGLGSRELKESDVVFVLGDNEELKGLKSHCVSNNVLGSGTQDCNSVERTSDRAFKVRSSGYLSDVDISSLLASEPKVITVKSSYIDLVRESGRLRTEIDDEADTVNAPVIFSSSSLNAIPRSSSVSLPVAKHKRPKRASKLARRHTEKYCDGCKTALKLQCRSRESVPSGAFVSCDKCACAGQQPCGDTGSLGDREAGWSRAQGGQEPVSVELASEDIESSLEVEDCLREDNAIFEQYDPSDEEILGPQEQKSDTRATVPENIGYHDLQKIELPLPSCDSGDFEVVGLAASLLGGLSGRYIPDLVLQGCSMLPLGWEASLRRDLTLAAKLPLLGQDISEAVCIVANTQTWEVQLVSSHAYVVDKPGTFGVCVGMSQLVANMLESLVHLWKLKMPPENCLLHLESKLQEVYLRSQALAELLLTTEFCNMEFLTSSLDLEANDVPLLLAVASTHSPQIAHRYGLTFC